MRIGVAGIPLVAKGQQLATQGDDPGSESHQISILVCPLNPGGFVVLAIRVVVATLGMTQFIPGTQHRSSLRQKCGCQQYPLQARPQREDLGIVRRTFLTTIEALVVALAIAVVFPVGQVMPIVVTHQVSQGKAIVRNDVVYRLSGGALTSLTVLVQIR